MDEILHRVGKRWLQNVDADFLTFWDLLRLYADRRGVVVAADRPATSPDYESALRLRLVDPRIGESAPAGLKL